MSASTSVKTGPVRVGGIMTKPTFRRASVRRSSLSSGVIPLDEYRALVDECAKHRYNFPIANGSALHARILISKLLEIAEEEVVVVSGCLTDQSSAGDDVYGHEPVIRSAKRFLSNPNAHLSIVVQEGHIHGGNDNRFLRNVINDPDRQGILTITVPKHGILGEEIPHFMISDQSSYRLETGPDARDKNTDKMTAVANFGDKKTAEEMRTYFDEVIDYITIDNLNYATAYGPEMRVS